jgi:hypothetical protein
LYDSCIITKKRRGGITWNTKISQQPSKPYNLLSSSSQCSKFCLCTRPRYICLLLRLPCKRRWAKKNAVSCDGTMIRWVTRPSGVRVSMKLKRTSRTNTEMRSPLSISAHEVNVQNERR